MNRVVIMQPYLFPYIGYFQLMKVADAFVIYDNIEYTKKGWINRNRILVNGKDSYITFPLKSDSDFLHIRNRFLSNSWPEERMKLVSRIRESYRKAPQFDQVFPIIEEIIMCPDFNLFGFILNSLTKLKNHLGLPCNFIVSSELAIDHTLKSEDKVISICKHIHADVYINPSGGINLYNKDRFNLEGIDLQFLFPNEIRYKQFNNDFIPSLSIIDVLMFNSKEHVQASMLDDYVLKS